MDKLVLALRAYQASVQYAQRCVNPEEWESHIDWKTLHEQADAAIAAAAAPPLPALAPFRININASLVRDEEGDYLLFCPRINDAAKQGYSELEVLKAIGAD